MQAPSETSFTIEQVITCPKLPTLPAVAVEVLRLTREPDVPIKKIAEVVQNDQAICAKILKTVNSSYYGLSTPCPSISRAMSYMGLNTVKSLVLGFSLVDNFKGIDEQATEDNFDLMGHWRRALYAAAGARLLAKHSSVADPDECFIAALLHDVGSLAMFVAMGREYADVVREHPAATKEVCTAERKALGFTRIDAGVGLAKAWRLPEALQDSIAFLHDADSAPDAHRRIVRCVSLAVLAAVGLGEPPRPASIREFKKLANDWLGIEHDDVERLLKDLTAGASELSKLFSLATGARPDLQAILAEAEEARMAHHIAVEREQNKLAEQAYTDGLTGIPNRKRFDEVLEQAFNDANDADGAVAVVFCDADKFKSVNDTHGHQTGDAVLVELARRLTAALAGVGTVCRYGGEEIAIVMPNTCADIAAQHAETIRAVVADTPFDVRNTGAKVDELPVTISVGIAARDPGSGSLIKSPDVLLRAADKAVYAAKKAGRNCTRRIRFTNPAAAPEKDAPTANPPAAAETPPAPRPKPVPATGATTAPSASPSAPTAHRFDNSPTNWNVRASILIVEDDQLQAKLLFTPLRAAFPNASIEVANSLAQAEGFAEAHPHDLILCDDNLGDGRAADLIGCIRSLPNHRFVPIIVLSADASREAATNALSAGATAYVPKANLFDDPRARLYEIVSFWTKIALAA
ncbi:MAG: HDOD domain-containing protein [Phycisphaerales bacterium]|nr:HDOD domain-containing protein [Phycisphaerales bacterium]